MTDPTTNAIILDRLDVRRLISIAARWELLARLAADVSAMADGKWAPLLFRTREDTHRAVQELVTLVHAGAPEMRALGLEQADGVAVSPLVLGPTEADVIGELVRRALLASKLLRPLLTQLPESSRTWWDARKIVDRLDFDGRELLGYVRLINPDRVSEILAQIE